LQGEPAADGLVRIEVRGPTGKVFDLFLHDDSALPAKVAYSGRHPMSGAAAEFEESFEDYREVNGILRPYRMVTNVDGTVFAEATVTEIVVNPEIAADRFRRPSS